MKSEFKVEYIDRITNRAGMFKVHTHDHLEITVFLGCEDPIFYLVDNEICKPAAGDIIIIRPNALHGCCKKIKAKYRRLNITIPVKMLDFLRDTDPELHSFLYNGDTLVSPYDKEADAFGTVIEEITNIQNEGSRHCDSLLFSCIIKLLVLLCSSSKNASPDQSHSGDKLLESIIMRINRDYASLSSVRDIGHALSYTSGYLSKYFRKHMNIGLHEFLIEKKLSVAAANLAAGMSVTECGLECGFSCTSYFIQVFKSRYGVTPGEYSKNNS